MTRDTSSNQELTADIVDLKIEVAKISLMEKTLSRLDLEIFGEPGNPTSGLKYELVKLRSSMNILTFVGATIASVMIVDLITKLIAK